MTDDFFSHCTDGFADYTMEAGQSGKSILPFLCAAQLQQ